MKISGSLEDVEACLKDVLEGVEAWETLDPD